MTVTELAILDMRYMGFISAKSISNINKRKLGFSVNETSFKNNDFIDIIIMNQIKSANLVLRPTDNVRIPTWMDTGTFNSFISKIELLCN